MAIIYGGRSTSSLQSPGTYSSTPSTRENVTGTIPSRIVSVAPHTVFDDIRQDIINGLNSAQAEATGWNAIVTAGIPVSAVVRTSNTVVTITLPAFGSYDITADETITVTVPATAVAGAAPIVATPTFSVSAFVVAGVRAAVRTVLQAVNRASYF
jgi:hypothetical protein